MGAVSDTDSLILGKNVAELRLILSVQTSGFSFELFKEAR